MPSLELSARRTASGWPAVGLLATCMFVVGTSELVIPGLLPVIAAELQTPVATAGYLVAAYALSFAIVTPVVAAVTTRVSRRRLLLGCLAGFVAANMAATVAASFAWLLVARVIAAAASGFFEVVATAAAAALVPEQQRGRAVALVISGFSVALLIGVPAGTLVGLTYNWRLTFTVLFLLGAVAALGVATLLPTSERKPMTEKLSLKSTDLITVLASTALAFTGVYVASTFIAVFLEQVTRVPGEAVAGVLLLIGLGSVVGNAVGGYAIDHVGVRITVVTACVLMIASLGAVSLFGTVPAAVAVCWAVQGASGGMFVPAQQARLLKVAPHAPELALAINLSALNMGISAGAALASGIVERGGLSVLGYVGAALVALALGLVVGPRSSA